MASKQDKQLQEITRKLEEGVKEMLTSENYYWPSHPACGSL